MKHLMLSAALVAALCGGSAALAQQKGDITIGLGLAMVQPKDDNGSLTTSNLDVDVSDSTRPTLTLEYFVMDNVGIELLAATPFEHDVELDTLGKVASVNQLPPTLSVQYHIPTGSKVTPLVGVGLNYTTFWNVDEKGALKGSKLSLDDSWGLAVHAGLDFAVTERGSIRADVRWMDIDSEVKLNGDKIGEAEIDPWVWGMSYIYKF